jgi:hypothetical protein
VVEIDTLLHSIISITENWDTMARMHTLAKVRKIAYLSVVFSSLLCVFLSFIVLVVFNSI